MIRPQKRAISLAAQTPAETTENLQAGRSRMLDQLEMRVPDFLRHALHASESPPICINFALNRSAAQRFGECREAPPLINQSLLIARQENADGVLSELAETAVNVQARRQAAE